MLFWRGAMPASYHLMARRALFSTRRAGILCVAILNQSGGIMGYRYVVQACFENRQVADEWLDWLRDGHCQEVLDGGQRIDNP